uniref:restriction endonuclease subunit S n=1 Tax=Chishuiella sp. TaxID=1969467 RepID=UPI0028AB692A
YSFYYNINTFFINTNLKEFFREQLFNFENSDVEWKELKDIAKISNGKDHKIFQNGSIPVYGSGGIMRYIDTSIYEEESVLIPRKGSIGNIFYVNEPFWTVDTIFYTRINIEIIISKYFYYFLKTKDLKKLNFAGGVPSLTKTVLDKIKIPIPSLKEQERIVKLLDQFDATHSAIEEEITKEIKLRTQQYEYYREKLLSFPQN